MVVEQAASATPIETRLAPDGVGYTWAEFESYFDADIAAAIWEAAEVDAAREPNSPRFDLPSEQGSILSLLSCHAPPLPLASLYYLIISKVFAYSIILFIDLLHVYV